MFCGNGLLATPLGNLCVFEETHLLLISCYEPSRATDIDP